MKGLLREDAPGGSRGHLGGAAGGGASKGAATPFEVMVARAFPSDQGAREQVLRDAETQTAALEAGGDAVRGRAIEDLTGWVPQAMVFPGLYSHLGTRLASRPSGDWMAPEEKRRAVHAEALEMVRKFYGVPLEDLSSRDLVEIRLSLWLRDISGACPFWYGDFGLVLDEAIPRVQPVRELPDLGWAGDQDMFGHDTGHRYVGYDDGGPVF